ELRLATGVDPVFDDFGARLKEQLAPVRQSPQDFAVVARTIVEKMALALQASLLIRFAPAAVSDAFVHSRMGPERCFNYGNLPASSDFAGILARA
ncbi:MAG: hypothetical protein WBX27_15500, partial [Specibacter sp.]